MRRALLTLLLVTSLAATAAVAAPAVSTRPYVPETVDFEVAPQGAAAGEEVGGDVVSQPIDAPKRFDFVGVTWRRGDVETDVDVRVRRAGGEWSPWTEATAEADHAPDPGRGEPETVLSSAPVWAGGSDEVQYRTSDRLGGVKLEFLNTTGTATAAERAETAVREAANKSVAGVVSLFSATAAAPSMYNRNEWDPNNECRPRDEPETGEVRAVFVHHTVNANGYSESQSDSLVRGICLFHRNSNGWDDIGYNFLVDKYGNIFEGRAGGISRAIIGAQAQGWNAQSTGVANIGTFSSSGQSSAGLRAMDRLISWKLDTHGVPRGGRTTLTSAGGETNRYSAGDRVGFNRISGHRNGNLTDCPGSALYSQLPRLRAGVEEGGDSRAPATPRSLSARSGPGVVTLDWASNGESDLAGYRIYRRTENGDYASLATTRSSAYTDRSVRGGETYYYRVKAYDDARNHSAWSNYARGRPTVPYERIVDNRDPNLFEASTNWRSSSRVSTRYGADYRFASPQRVSDAASFELRAPRAGNYAIYIRYPSHPDYNSNAPIGVDTHAGVKWTRRDMRTRGGRWSGLGTFTLRAGERPHVRVSRWTTADGWLIADAVRLVER